VAQGQDGYGKPHGPDREEVDEVAAVEHAPGQVVEVVVEGQVLHHGQGDGWDLV